MHREQSQQGSYMEEQARGLSAITETPSPWRQADKDEQILRVSASPATAKPAHRPRFPQ